MDERFFFLYHMKVDENVFMRWPVYERRWMIERFIQQKNKENEAIEEARRQAKSK